MEFFTLITQVSSRSDHSDAHMGQARTKSVDISVQKKMKKKKGFCTNFITTNA